MGTMSRLLVKIFVATQLSKITMQNKIRLPLQDCHLVQRAIYQLVLCMERLKFSVTFKFKGLCFQVCATNGLIVLRSFNFFLVPTLPPENLQVLSVTAYSIEVTWDDVLCSGQNGPITGYAVVYMYDSSELIVEFNTSITLENLLPYTTYLIRITPINEVGKGYSSALLTQQTEESGQYTQLHEVNTLL